MQDFKTPPDHINFLAKKLFGDCGKIIDGSIAYIKANGGGPTTPHTHPYSHLFIVFSGEVTIRTEDGDIVLRENESYLVDGTKMHSVWNNLNSTAIMVGISVVPE